MVQYYTMLQILNFRAVVKFSDTRNKDFMAIIIYLY